MQISVEFRGVWLCIHHKPHCRTYYFIAFWIFTKYYKLEFQKEKKNSERRRNRKKEEKNETKKKHNNNKQKKKRIKMMK